MNSWNRTDLRALSNLIVVMVAIIVSVANPEMRRFVCLQSKSCPSSQTTSTKVFIQNQPASHTPTTTDKPILTTSISDNQLVTALDQPRAERTDGHDKSQVLEFRNTATSYLAFNLYATWLIFKNPLKKGKASHRYNRNTRLIEGNED